MTLSILTAKLLIIPQKSIVIITLMLLTFVGTSQAQHLQLSTRSDSCVHYYYEGWRQVMDQGNYTASAVAFRKMASFDSGFWIGQALLGRISENLEEQETILENIEQHKRNVTGDERLLLDIFTELLKLTILRQKDPSRATEQLKKALQIGEENFRTVVHKYPGEVYYKSEYIEVLNYNHGAQVALDSLYALTSKQQKKQPFLLGFAAHLEAELGNIDNAKEKARMLEKVMADQKAPKPYVVWADVLYAAGEYDKAMECLEKGLEIDPGNLDAIRLKSKLESKN
ncbi:MAG: tetratricopeptide repeat protein [Bacteroidota bacterium]